MPGKAVAKLPWPVKGLSDALSYTEQSPLTTVDCQNVRGFDPSTGRLRGGSRAGHTKYNSSTVNSSNAVQYIDQVSVGSAVSGNTVRTTYNVAVAGGTVKLFTSGSFTTATNGSAALDTTSPFLWGSELFGVIYFADGVNAKKWTAATNTVAAWTPSAGSLPASTSKPRLICTWRGRIVLSGVVGDDQNWFMSAVNNALDWDYAPATITSTIAIAGNNSAAGKVGDLVTALIPFNDDVLVFGGDHSLWQMSNDPGDNGRIDRISDVTGVAFGPQTWCKDDKGRVYFWGSRGGLYRLVPGSQPEKLSDPIETRLASISLTTTIPHLIWDDKYQSVMVYLTPTDGSSGTHYVYDTRTEAWWRDVFATAAHQPRCVQILDGDTAGDRVTLQGCGDGYIRYIDSSVKNDDGVAISSYCWLGPVHLKDGNAFRFDALEMTLGSASDDITYGVYAGQTAAAALAATAGPTGTWTAARNWAERTRRQGSELYIKLVNSTISRSWQYESGSVDLLPMGNLAGRKWR